MPFLHPASPRCNNRLTPPHTVSSVLVPSLFGTRNSLFKIILKEIFLLLSAPWSSPFPSVRYLEFWGYLYCSGFCSSNCFLSCPALSTPMKLVLPPLYANMPQIRNYQARNIMRDQMKVGDLAFFYHSNCKQPGIAGVWHREKRPMNTRCDRHRLSSKLHRLRTVSVRGTWNHLNFARLKSRGYCCEV